MSTENRFGDVGGGQGGGLGGGLGRRGGGGFDVPKLGSFGAGAAVSAADVNTSIKEFAVSTPLRGHGEVQGNRSRSEAEFYSRKPSSSSFSLGKEQITYQQLSEARRTENGNIQIGDKVVSSQDFLQMRKTFQSIDSSYRESYKKWWDEGMARGYVAGSPYERL